MRTYTKSELEETRHDAYLDGMKRATSIAARYNVNRGAGSATARAIITALFLEIKAAEDAPKLLDQVTPREEPK